MPIDITCPGCKKRFKVSEKFAGQKGPCPNCKTVIQIPAKGEEVVVHAPEQFGPKGKTGVAVLKPIRRQDAKVTPLMLTAWLGGIFVTLIGALILRLVDPKPSWLLGMLALLVAPPLVWAGYGFLRDDELEPHRGKFLILRVAICSVVYALLWGAYAWGPSIVMGDTDPLKLFTLLFVVPPLMVVEALAALASLDLDFGTGLIHYGFYLLVTVVLCFLMGLDLLAMPATSS